MLSAVLLLGNSLIYQANHRLRRFTAGNNSKYVWYYVVPLSDPEFNDLNILVWSNWREKHPR
jgi:hypothetical protein